MKNALKIAPDGTAERIDLDLGAELHGDELKAMQFIVGGYIEQLPTGSDQFCMFANEDGRMKQLAPNDKASRLATAYSYTNLGVVGTVIVTGREKNGETTGLSDEQIEQILR